MSPVPLRPTQQGNLPEVPFVGGVLDVVADIVEHSVGCGAVSGIEHLWKVHDGIAGCLLSPGSPQGRVPFQGSLSPLQLHPVSVSQHPASSILEV